MRLFYTVLLFCLMLPGLAQESMMRVFYSNAATDLGARGDLASFSSGDLLVLVGSSAGNSFQLMRLNKDLQITQSALYGFSYPLNNLQVAVSGDTVYVAGNIQNESSSNMLLCAFNGQLQMLNSLVLENTLNYHIYTFDVHPYGGLYAVGFLIGNQGGATGNVGNFAMRFAGNGQISWFKNLSYASKNWGLASHTQEGEIIGSGSGRAWAFGPNGQLKWMREYFGFLTMIGSAQVGNKLFVGNYAYNSTEQELFCTHLDAPGYTPVDSYIGSSPHFIGATKSMCLVGSSYLTADSAYLKLVFYGLDGKIKRQQIQSQAFGFAPTGALRDACTYAYHLRSDGTPFVLGVANQAGFFVLKLEPEGGFSCAQNQGFQTPGGQSGPTEITGIQTFDHSTAFTALSSQEGSVIPLSDSLYCRTCKPILYRLPSDTVLCEGDSLTVPITGQAFSWAWLDGTQQNPRIIKDSSDYKLRLYSDCDTVTDTLRVRIQAKPVFQIWLSDSFPDPEERVYFRPNPDTFQSYTWMFGRDTLSYTSQFDTALSENGLYPFRLRVGESGCYSTQQVRVKVLEIDWYLPTAFTPNSDGLNDTWGPEGRGLRHYTLLIFNRWGELVFEGSNTHWDGRFRSAFVPDGQYLFVLQGLTDAYEKVNRKGILSVVR